MLTRSPTPNFEELADSAATIALTGDLPARYIEQKRSGEGYRSVARTGHYSRLRTLMKTALAQRKPFFLYMAERRLVRP